MASNGFAKVLKRNSWRLTTILVYAVLEWVLIFLLLLSALFQYITTKFASFFGLHPPCLWCSRLDHIIEPKEPDFYRKLVCERHAQEISLLGYCLTHRKLAEAHGMCEECASSRHDHVSGAAEGRESNPNWIACMSMVADMGFDPSKKAGSKRLLMNGHIDEFKPQDTQSEEKSINGWVSEDLCSCCNAPLDRKLYPHNIFKTILFSGGEKAILKSQWNALDYDDGVLEDDEGKKQSRCVCGGTRIKISEVLTDSPQESDEASSSNASDGEVDSRIEEVDSGSIGLEENEKDASDTHCNELPDEAQNKPRSLEVVVEDDDDDDAGVDIQPDICIDKRIAYPEIVTQECAMVSDVTVTEIAIEDISNDQVTKTLDFIEETPEAHMDGLISETATEALEDQNQVTAEDMGHQDEAPTLDIVCNSLAEEEENTSQAVMEKGVDTDVDSLEVTPKSFEVFPNAEDTNENCTEHSLDHTVIVSQPFQVNNDDQSTSMTSEGAADEPKVLEDSDVDRTRESEADHHTADIFTEVQATSTDVASQETTMEITQDMDMDSREEEVHAGECQVPEDIEVISREEQTCNGHVEGVHDDESSQIMDQTEIKTGHQNVQVDADKIDEDMDQTEIKTGHQIVQVDADKIEEDRASETPRSIEGVQLLGKRMLFDRRDSGAESLDGSVLSEFDGEVEVDRLKRALASERKSLNTLYSELEEERNAAAVAANQTMAMITRLQEEKAAVQMEALQYQRMMEEQSEYDQEALQLLNEILVKREKEKQDLEKELDLYRKKVMRYEANERRMEKRRKTEECESPLSLETKEETPDNQRNRTSSSSSLSENSDDVSSDANDADDQLEAQQSNQNTPADLIMSAGRGYDTEQRTSLDESLVDFEEERLSILEQLKVLEEKLHTLANDDQGGMAHAETNGIEDDMKRTDVDKETMETMNGNITPTARRGKAKRLLPLFDATNVEEDSMHNTQEISSAVDPSNDWRTVSMVVRDNNRIAVEEEVYNLYERLQALEADREFLKHTIKSLRKGDEGMKLLQEIAEHLRDLRRVELKARNFSDIM